MFLRPSASAMWFECGAMPYLATSLPTPPESDAAREGTAAAWVAEVVINGDATSALDMLGETAPNGWDVDDDMVRHVDGYLKIIAGLRCHQQQAEVPVTLVPELCGGTADFMGIAGRTLYVIDLKYGFDIVEAWQNRQLTIYGAAMWQIVKDQVDRVEMAIYQPRAPHTNGPLRWFSVSSGEMGVLHAMMVQKVHERQKANLERPGKHCRYCPAAMVCEGLKQSAYGLEKVLSASGTHHLTPAELAQELDILDRIEAIFNARATAAREQAAEMIRQGGYIPGWTMQRRKGQRYLKPDRADLLAAMTGVDVYERKLKTPAQLEREHVSPEVLEPFVDQPMTDWKLGRVKPDSFNKDFPDPPKGMPK